MSDFRDPRNPISRDPIYDSLGDRSFQHMRSQSMGSGVTLAWFLGLLLFIAVLIFTVGGAQNPQVADSETGRAVPAGVTRDGPEPARQTQPPASTPSQPAKPAQ